MTHQLLHQPYQNKRQVQYTVHVNYKITGSFFVCFNYFSVEFLRAKPGVLCRPCDVCNPKAQLVSRISRIVTLFGSTHCRQPFCTAQQISRIKHALHTETQIALGRIFWFTREQYCFVVANQFCAFFKVYHRFLLHVLRSPLSASQIDNQETPVYTTAWWQYLCSNHAAFCLG